MARKKKTETSEVTTEETISQEAEQTPFHYGVWYVMKDDFSGWELYRRTKQTVAKAFPHPELPGKVVYQVWGSPQAGGPTVCETQQFVENVVRIATEEDAKLPPATPLY